MTSKLLTALAVASTTVLAIPAFADTRLVIEDDHYTYEQLPASLDFAIEIEDDGVIFMDRNTVTKSTMNVPNTDGTCSQIELSLDIRGADCGVISKSDLTRMIIDAHD